MDFRLLVFIFYLLVAGLYAQNIIVAFDTTTARFTSQPGVIPISGTVSLCSNDSIIESCKPASYNTAGVPTNIRPLNAYFVKDNPAPVIPSSFRSPPFAPINVAHTFIQYSFTVGLTFNSVVNEGRWPTNLPEDAGPGNLVASSRLVHRACLTLITSDGSNEYPPCQETSYESTSMTVILPPAYYFRLNFYTAAYTVDYGLVSSAPVPVITTSVPSGVIAPVFSIVARTTSEIVIGFANKKVSDWHNPAELTISNGVRSEPTIVDFKTDSTFAVSLVFTMISSHPYSVSGFYRFESVGIIPGPPTNSTVIFKRPAMPRLP